MKKNQKNLDVKLAYARLVNWKIFFLGYLDAARKCAQSYLQHQKSDIRIANDYAEFAFVPAFWNLKHAIELVLKFIIIMKEKVPQKIKDIKIVKTHDIRLLVGELILQRKISKDYASELIEICEKYIALKSLAILLDKKDPLFKAPYPALHDPENMFFKYPEGDDSHAGFEYYLYLDLFLRGVNAKRKEKEMQDAMTELQNDSKRLSILCANIFNSY